MSGLIYIVEDDPSVRKSLKRMARFAGYEAEAFASAEEFLSIELAPSPCCLVLDVRLPGLDGLELQERLARKEAPVSIIFISGHGDIPMTVKAIKKGAVDFLPKPFSDGNLLDVIEGALARSVQLQQALSRKNSAHALVATLTPREHEILRWVITGMLNKQVAGELGITLRTVKAHRARVMQKMKAESVAELVRLAEEAGIGPAEP